MPGTQYDDVQIFQVPDLSADATDFADDYGGVFDGYFIRYYYARDKHIEQLPTAAPRGNGAGIASIVQLADPTRMVIVDWEARKKGGIPVIPHPEIADPNLVLKQDFLNPQGMELIADGDTTFTRIGGRYVYAMIDPSKTVFRMGLMPWIDDSRQQDAVIGSDAFQHGIIDGQGMNTPVNPLNEGAVGGKIIPGG